MVVSFFDRDAKELDKGYWFNELDSLGIHAKRKNGLNDREEIKDLVENTKQAMLQIPQRLQSNYSYSFSSSSSVA